jgi:hypothetical protein
MINMSDVRSSIAICKRIKERLQNLDFVKKHTDEKIVEILMDFYDGNKSQFKKWQTKK